MSEEEFLIVMAPYCKAYSKIYLKSFKQKWLEEDFYQEAMVLSLNAFRTFDPGKGCKMENYAVGLIKWGFCRLIYREVNSRFSGVKHLQTAYGKRLANKPLTPKEAVGLYTYDSSSTHPISDTDWGNAVSVVSELSKIIDAHLSTKHKKRIMKILGGGKILSADLEFIKVIEREFLCVN